MLPIFGVFMWIGIALAVGYETDDLGSRLVGVGMLMLVGTIAVVDLTQRVVIADPAGVHALLRRRVSWQSVQWADLDTFVPGFLPNVTIRLVGKDTDPATGQLREYRLPGLAGFTAGRRHHRTVAQFNDWIAAADPDWVVNPWLHRSDRPDNR